MGARSKIALKGIPIDPATGEIKEVEVRVSADGDIIQSMYEFLSCTCVDVGRGGLEYLPSHSPDDVWFDDEGAFQEDNPGSFEIPGWIPLIGKGLILGCDHLGHSVDHTLTAADLEVLRKPVKFCPPKERKEKAKR